MFLMRKRFSDKIGNVLKKAGVRSGMNTRTYRMNVSEATEVCQVSAK